MLQTRLHHIYGINCRVSINFSDFLTCRALLADYFQPKITQTQDFFVNSFYEWLSETFANGYGFVHMTLQSYGLRSCEFIQVSSKEATCRLPGCGYVVSHVAFVCIICAECVEFGVRLRKITWAVGYFNFYR